MIVSREVTVTTPPSRPPRAWKGEGEVLGVVPLLYMLVMHVVSGAMIPAVYILFIFFVYYKLELMTMLFIGIRTLFDRVICDWGSVGVYYQ